jgi:hypothetical protein
MQYAPPISSNIGNILASAGANSAQSYMQGMQQFSKGISDGLESAAGSIAGGMEKAQTQAAKLQGAQATVQAMQSILPQYGDQGIALGNALTKDLEKAGTNADKISGTIMAYQPAMQSLIQTDHSVQVANAQGKNYQALAQIKADAKTVADPKLDANYARQSYQGLRERGYNHDQAIEGMKASGLNWGTQYIDRPANDGFFGVTR